MCRHKVWMIIVVLLLMITAASVAFAKKTYTKSQLVEMGGKSIVGLVEKVGAYNFFIKTSDGESVNIHTDNKTIQFVPKEERLMIGDRVDVLYLGAESASRSVDRMIAAYIEFIEKVPREFFSGEMICVLSISKHGIKACYLPEYDKLINIEGLFLEDSHPGMKIKIKLRTVPANIGNGYIYKAKESI